MHNIESARPFELLLVEDNPADVVLTKEALQRADHPVRVTVVEDGEEALKLLNREGDFRNAPTPALIFLDLNLPRIDGKEVLRQIKSDPQLCHIPVVVLSTSTARRDVLDAFQLHANCFVPKPINFDDFLAVVRSIQHFWLEVVKLPETV